MCPLKYILGENENIWKTAKLLIQELEEVIHYAKSKNIFQNRAEKRSTSPPLSDLFLSMVVVLRAMRANRSDSNEPRYFMGSPVVVILSFVVVAVIALGSPMLHLYHWT